MLRMRRRTGRGAQEQSPTGTVVYFALHRPRVLGQTLRFWEFTVQLAVMVSTNVWRTGQLGLGTVGAIFCSTVDLKGAEISLKWSKFQRIATRDKKAFLRDQCKEIEENNSMGKTRDLFKKIRVTKGTFHANGLDKGQKWYGPNRSMRY